MCKQHESIQSIWCQQYRLDGALWLFGRKFSWHMVESLISNEGCLDGHSASEQSWLHFIYFWKDQHACIIFQNIYHNWMIAGTCQWTFSISLDFALTKPQLYQASIIDWILTKPQPYQVLSKWTGLLTAWPVYIAQKLLVTQIHLTRYSGRKDII